MINNQRNSLSMTMATYFQSSFTCRQKRTHCDRGQALGEGSVPPVHSPVAMTLGATVAPLRPLGS